MIDKFKQCLDGAERVIITAHISPDPDSVASTLLLGTTLQLNFPDKKIQMALEEEPDSLDFLNGYNLIEFGPVNQAVKEFKPDLLVMVDVNTFARCSRRGGAEIQQFIKENKVKTAIIDHHEHDGKDQTDVYVDSGNPAAAQEVYELCFEQLKLKKPEGYAATTMAGLYSDTGGFLYANPKYKETFRLASELVDAGANIELIKNQLTQFSEDQMRVIGELAVNISHEGDFTYTYISDEFAEKWQSYDKPIAGLRTACRQFINNYIRNVDNRGWGFLVYRNPLEGEDCYSVSLRSMSGVKDVAQVAAKLDGGGHKSSAAGKVQAANVEGAIEKVKAAIQSKN